MAANSVEAQCGTYPGYQRHRKSGEPACDPCRHACARYRDGLRRQKAYPPPDGSGGSRG